MGAQLLQFLTFALIGFALILIVEGLIYALFPDRMKALRKALTDKQMPYAKRDGLLFYDLRAAAITRMLASGMPPPLVQKIAGHTHITTTMRYCGQLEAEQRAAVKSMAAALGG